jgi:hypothetical protein
MYQIFWELKVKFKEREKFEAFYDPKGKWVKFFSQSADYLGTEVLESGEGDNAFLVVDEWVSEEAFVSFIEANKTAYLQLEENAQSVSRNKKRIWINSAPKDE